MTRVRVYPSVVDGVVDAPPSKSYTHRAITLAALSSGVSRITNPLIAMDTRATLNAARAFGAEIIGGERSLTVRGVDRLQIPENVIDAENSGTTIRLMTSVSALAPEGYTVLTGDESLRRRPMQPLLNSLRDLGVECWSTRLNGKPPIVVKGGGIKGGETTIKGDISSQFISSLLVSTPKALSDTTIHISGRMVSKPYIEATIMMIQLIGGSITRITERDYHIKHSQTYTPTDMEIPGDFSSAAFILASAALTGGEVEVGGLNFNLPQADSLILNILHRLGAEVEVKREECAVRVKGPKEALKGGEFDLSDTPDLLPVLAVLGLRCREGIRVRGVEHAKFKETDRLSVLAEELSKIVPSIILHQDGIDVKPSTFKHAILDARGDHRMFMAFCLAGLASPHGCIVEGSESVEVSYPTFINDMRKIKASLESE